MRICLILEGSYPYTFGGVSSWTHQMICQMPDIDFVLWVIGARAEDRGKFVYELPKNVKEVHEVFLDDALKIRGSSRISLRLSEEEKTAIRELMNCGRPDWKVLFSLFRDRKVGIGDLLMGEDFLDIMTDLCREDYPYIPYADTFHMMRSMLLPVFYMCQQEIPDADIYHAICTGYAGLLGSMASIRKGKPLLLTEHGIYSREREEEIIRADWVEPIFKRHWIRFFYMLSSVIYENAFRVTNLFYRAGQTQIDLGAPKERVMTIPNGIDYDRFSKIPLKVPDGFIDIGALIRLAPIKDVKTLIYAFFEVSKKMPNVRLHILGGTDDEDYAKECYELKEELGLDRLIFTGRVDSAEYMEKLDFTVLSSISEGQPLSILESFAAGRPCVATEVGCCRELIEGDRGDHFGNAGFIVPPMHRELLASALIRMAENPDRIRRYGQRGKERAKAFYRREDMVRKYRELYELTMESREGHGSEVQENV